jgi:hypothetical protein
MAEPVQRAVERRRNPRQRALLSAKLASDDAAQTLDCVIRNISPTGALIETTSPNMVPRELHLVQIRDGTAWDAEVIWRRGNLIGLALKDRHDLKTTTAKQLRALRAIWTHMVAH